MRFLGRLVVVCALLGGLGYGSYAFGRYVLSNYMFGPTFGARPGSVMDAGQAAKPVTRQIEYKGQKPNVQVQVLPADEAGPGPVPPSSEVLERETQALPTPPAPDNSSGTATRMVPQRPRKFEEGERAARLGDDSLSDDRTSRRRDDRTRRRRRRTNSTSSRTVRREAPVSNDTNDSAPTRSEQRSFEADTPRAESRSDAPRVEEPRRSNRSERTSRPERREPRRESPVPRPEGGSSGGGESPVPQPE